MKFHRLLRLEGFHAGEIRLRLRRRGFSLGPMGGNHYWQNHYWLCNKPYYKKIQIFIEDNMVEVRGDSGTKVHKVLNKILECFDQDVSATRYTKTDIGFGETDWAYQKANGQKINVVESSNELQ